MTRKLRKSFSEFDKTLAKEPNILFGELGIPLGGKQVVEVVTRNGFVYVRLRSNTSEIIQAFNDKVSPAYGLPVLVVREGNRYVIKGRDTERYSDWGNDSPYLPRHGNAHSFNPDGSGGGDMVWVYGQQIMPALTFPSGSYGADNVLIASYPLKNLNGDWMYIGNTGTPSLTQYNPVSGSALILISIDTNTGNPYLQATTGTYIPESITSIQGLMPYLPDNNSPQYMPDSFVRLGSGTSVIDWGNIYDIRQFIPVLSTGTFIADGAITPVKLANASAQYKYLVAGATPFAYAESVGALNIASGKTLVVSESLTLTAGAAGYTLTVPGTGVALVKPTALTVGYIPFGIAANLVGEDAGLFWDNTNKRLGIIQVAPVAPLHVGDSTVNNSVDAQILISRAVNDDVAGNGHAFSDSSTITRSGTIAYNSFDGRTIFSGTNNYDHYALMQAAVTYNSSGTMTNLYGFINVPAISAGTITNSYGIKINNPTGAGALTNNYTAGATISYFGGAVSFADTTESTSASTGALKVSGGIGVAKNVYIAGKLGVGVNPSYYIDGVVPSGANRSILRLGVLGVTNGLTVDYTNTGTIITIRGADSQLIIGAPTGDGKGKGTINAQAVYDDGAGPLTDFVFEPDYKMLSISEMTRYYNKEKHLPTLPGMDEWKEKKGLSLGQMSINLWETIEVQARYITELNQRLEILEKGN